MFGVDASQQQIPFDFTSYLLLPSSIHTRQGLVVLLATMSGPRTNLADVMAQLQSKTQGAEAYKGNAMVDPGSSGVSDPIR